MRTMGTRGLACAVGCSLISTTALADTNITVDDVPVNVAFSGFVRADYGNGDRYSKADGEDILGVSKSLLLATITTEDVTAIFDVGATALTDGNVNPNDNGSVGIKDAFIIVGGDKPVGFSFSVGAQPLLFGLKPNGYPSDSSLVPNIDYGAAGGFAVSQQAGPSIIGVYKFTPDESLRFGAFDLAESNSVNVTTATNGSKLKDNYFLLWRGKNIGGTGVYATVGGERIYVGVNGGPIGNVGGAVVDGSKNIYSGGIGFKQDIFDVSVEYIHLDGAIVNTGSGERYLRAHASVQPAPQWTAYVDYSNGHELGASTYRIGGNWQFRRHLAATLEYTKDTFKSSNGVYNDNLDIDGFNPVTGNYSPYGSTPPANVESINARLTFTY